MTKNYFKKLEQGIQVPLPTDEDGFTGRECPNPACKTRFMIKFGTGLPDTKLCYCPYCGYHAPQDQFFTGDQIAYIQSVMMRKVEEAFGAMAKDLDRDLRRKTRGGLIQMKVDYRGKPQPIRYYQEKALETTVTCSNCTLAYKIFGEFAYCPDCGVHNSLQILQKNLELVRKLLGLAESQEGDFAEYLIRDALENCVSAFDGYGRELVRINATKASNPTRASRVSFQNLEGARQNIADLFGIDLSAGLEKDMWADLNRAFLKRHLLAHKMGVIDDEYIRKAGDASAIVGHKIQIRASEVDAIARQLERLARYLLVEMIKRPA